MWAVCCSRLSRHISGHPRNACIFIIRLRILLLTLICALVFPGTVTFLLATPGHSFLSPLHPHSLCVPYTTALGAQEREVQQLRMVCACGQREIEAIQEFAPWEQQHVSAEDTLQTLSIARRSQTHLHLLRMALGQLQGKQATGPSEATLTVGPAPPRGLLALRVHTLSQLMGLEEARKSGDDARADYGVSEGPGAVAAKITTQLMSEVAAVRVELEDAKKVCSVPVHTWGCERCAAQHRR